MRRLIHFSVDGWSSLCGGTLSESTRVTWMEDENDTICTQCLKKVQLVATPLPEGATRVGGRQRIGG
jgi:hypothetical protein